MTTALQGKYVWFELLTPDAKKAQAFYGEVFGWKVSPMTLEGTTYDMIVAGEVPVGGYVPTEGPAHWTSYLSVGDVDAALKRALDAGGKQLEAPFDVPTIGRMAKIADPTGASLWLFRTADGDTDREPAPGTFAWNELLTHDPDRAVAFYRQVAGYGHKAMDMGPMGTYHVLSTGEIPRAGVMKAMDAQQPAAWLPYVNVDDTDAAVARATRGGGTVLMPPADVPEVGRFAVVADPDGAAIGLMKYASRAA